MKIVCEWCKLDMGEKPGGEGTTGSICPKCRAEFFGNVRNSGQKTIPLDDQKSDGRFKSRVTTLLSELKRELQIKGGK